jgi:hypothetical protein
MSDKFTTECSWRKIALYRGCLKCQLHNLFRRVKYFFRNVVYLRQLSGLQDQDEFPQSIFKKMLKGILAMWDGAQTGRADAGNLEAS